VFGYFRVGFGAITGWYTLAVIGPVVDEPTRRWNDRQQHLGAGTEEPFRSELRRPLKGHSEALEDLAIERLARGLSVRDIEDAFKDESGRLLLSRTAVSEIGQRLWEDCQEFATRDLSEHDIAYLFVDGIAERIRPGQRREPVLAAWGHDASGAKVLLRLMAGSKEDAETVSAFFQDMRSRGLGDPLLVVSDGAPGIIKAIETCFPRSARQRRLPGAVPGHCPRPGGGGWPTSRPIIQAPWPASWTTSKPASAHPGHPSPRDADDKPLGEAVRRGAPAAQDHPQRLRRKAGPQAHVRRHDPRRRVLARGTDFERRQMAALRAELDQEYEASTGLANGASKVANPTNLSSKSRT